MAYSCHKHQMLTEYLLSQALEGFWLKNTKFVAGNKISVADLLLCTELSGLRLLDGAVKVHPRLLVGSSADALMHD